MKYRLTVFLIFIVFITYSQNSKLLHKDAVFGFQLSPIIPTTLFGGFNETRQYGALHYEAKDAFGYSMGVDIRYNLTNRFSLQTGLNFVKRNYNVSIIGLDTANHVFKNSEILNFISIEIPFSGLVFLQLSDEIFMSSSVGFVLNNYPHDVEIVNDSIQNYIWGLKYYDVKFSMAYSLGFEYRTKNSGTFYLGGLYNRNMNLKTDMFKIGVFDPFNSLAESPTAVYSVPGHYFALSLKYFFPVNETIND